MDIPIVYTDNRILLCLKPPGVVSVDQPGGLPQRLRAQLGGEGVCLRTVHRLDQPVGGLMVLARSRQAAKLLSQQMEERTHFHKAYLAVVRGKPADREGTLRDLLGYDRTTRRAYVAQEPGREVRPAVLHYRVAAHQGEYTLLAITLETGRTHQIRVQLASRGLPLVGDCKYGAPPADMEGIALWSYRLSFLHPQSGEGVAFSALPPAGWPWSVFDLRGMEDAREEGGGG